MHLVSGGKANILHLQIHIKKILKLLQAFLALFKPLIKHGKITLISMQFVGYLAYIWQMSFFFPLPSSTPTVIEEIILLATN